MIGLTLGLLGSGGSILTIPVLVYLLGHNDKVAIAESLAIVGGIAFSTSIRYAIARGIAWDSVLLFGLPAMGATYVSAWLSERVPGSAQLIVFGGVMITAAWLMFRGSRRTDSNQEEIDESEQDEKATKDGEPQPGAHAVWMVVVEGIAVGALTGFVGVGGGFLIVPALVLLGGLPMRLAVGTSLAIITLNSASGFIKHLGVLESLNLEVDWGTIAWFCVVGAVGSFVGSYISRRIDQQSLKKGFAVFLVVMGAFVLVQEIPKVTQASPDSANTKTDTENKQE